MFLGGLRISEVVGNGMGDFIICSDPKSGDQRWRLQATSMGDKERLIPATAELMTYRRSPELSDLPQASEPSSTWTTSMTHAAPTIGCYSA